MQRTQLEIVILSALVHVKQLKPIETIAWHLNDISTIIFFNCPNWTLKQRLSCSFSCVTHNPSSPKELMSGNPDDSQGVRLTDIHHHSVETEKQIYPHWVCQSPLLSFDRVEMWWSTHLEKWHGHGHFSHGGCHTEHHNVKKHNYELYCWMRPSEIDS